MVSNNHLACTLKVCNTFGEKTTLIFVVVVVLLLLHQRVYRTKIAFRIEHVSSAYECLPAVITISRLLSFILTRYRNSISDVKPLLFRNMSYQLGMFLN